MLKLAGFLLVLVILSVTVVRLSRQGACIESTRVASALVATEDALWRHVFDCAGGKPGTDCDNGDTARIADQTDKLREQFRELSNFCLAR